MCGDYSYMINICIVENEETQADLLRGYLAEYEKSKGQRFQITHLSDGEDLVDSYAGQYDILLLDIKMQHMNGMTAAERIRQIDQDVIIIFITSTVMYAVQGYSVDALGYVLKPVPYPAFEQLIDKAVTRVIAKSEKVYVKISAADRQLKLDCASILYIESQRNNVIIHTDSEEYTTLGPLKKYEALLCPHGFSKCHNAYLVNLSLVEGIKKEEVLLSTGIRLPISRARKKEFMTELTGDLL